MKDYGGEFEMRLDNNLYKYMEYCLEIVVICLAILLGVFLLIPNSVKVIGITLFIILPIFFFYGWKCFFIYIYRVYNKEDRYKIIYLTSVSIVVIFVIVLLLLTLVDIQTKTIYLNSTSENFPSNGQCEIVQTSLGEAIVPQHLICYFNSSIKNLATYYAKQDNPSHKNHTIFSSDIFIPYGDSVGNSKELIHILSVGEDNQTINGHFFYPIVSEPYQISEINLNSTIINNNSDYYFHANQQLGVISFETITIEEYNRRRNTYLYAIFLLITACLFAIPPFVEGTKRIFEGGNNDI